MTSSSCWWVSVTSRWGYRTGGSWNCRLTIRTIVRWLIPWEVWMKRFSHVISGVIVNMKLSITCSCVGVSVPRDHVTVLVPVRIHLELSTDTLLFTPLSWVWRLLHPLRLNHHRCMALNVNLNLNLNLNLTPSLTKVLGYSSWIWDFSTSHTRG